VASVGCRICGFLMSSDNSLHVHMEPLKLYDRALYIADATLRFNPVIYIENLEDSCRAQLARATNEVESNSKSFVSLGLCVCVSVGGEGEREVLPVVCSNGISKVV